MICMPGINFAQQCCTWSSPCLSTLLDNFDAVLAQVLSFVIGGRIYTLTPSQYINTV